MTTCEKCDQDVFGCTCPTGSKFDDMMSALNGPIVTRLIAERDRARDERDKLTAMLATGSWSTEYTCTEMVNWRPAPPMCGHSIVFRRVWTGAEQQYEPTEINHG